MSFRKISCTMIPCIFALTMTGSRVVAAVGPSSELYLTDGASTHQLFVVQGGNVNRQWSIGQEFAVAVGTQVRTQGWLSGGRDYSIGGTLLGNNASGVPASLHFDGTTDGSYNYSVNFDTGAVERYNLDWSGGSTLFNTSGSYLGVTYDTADNTLWLSQYSGTLVEHRSMTGTLLGSFNTGHSHMAALALDPADGTLWHITQFGNTLYQYSKSGTLLQSVNYNGIGANDILGGEFAMVPEPTTLGVLSLGATMMLRRKRKN